MIPVPLDSPVSIGRMLSGRSSGYRSANRKFKLQRVLSGDSKPVYTASISIAGKYLACGSEDSLIVWDLHEYTERFSSMSSFQFRGQVTCSGWINQSSDREAVCFCTTLGYIVVAVEGPAGYFHELLSRKVTEKMISSIACETALDKDTARIVIATDDGQVQLHQLTCDRQLLNKELSLEIDDIIPVSIFFVSSGANNLSNIQIFGAHGNSYVLSGKDGSVIKTTNLGSLTGFAAMSPKDDLIVFNTIRRGFNAHRLHDFSHIINYNTKNSLESILPYPAQVSLVNDNREVVTGSLSSTARIYDLKTGKLVDELLHPPHAPVQTVTTRDYDQYSLVICASSGLGRENSTAIWISQPKNEPGFRVLSRASQLISRILIYFCGFLVFGLLWEVIIRNLNHERPQLTFEAPQSLDFISGIFHPQPAQQQPTVSPTPMAPQPEKKQRQQRKVQVNPTVIELPSRFTPEDPDLSNTG